MQKRWTAHDIPDLTGKTAVVTGANSGLGVASAQALAAAGARVIMACRNKDKAGRAAEEIGEKEPAAHLEILPLDLADLASIRAFAASFHKNHDRLDILLNNAGIMAVPEQRTADGFEMQFGTNHLGHFALTGLLLDALHAAGQARVVTLSSLAHKIGRIRLDDPNWSTDYDKWKAYGQSKLANLMFARELDRRLRAQGESIASLAAHPGYSDTNLQYVGPEQSGSKLGRLATVIGNTVIGQSRERGALPGLFAATAPDATSGTYYGPGGIGEVRGYPAPARVSRRARDRGTAEKLWTLSEKLTKVGYLDG